jgi:hypothetical protein
VALIFLTACDSEPEELGERRNFVIADDNFAEGGCGYPGAPTRFFSVRVEASFEELVCTRSEENRNPFDGGSCEAYGWMPRREEVPYRIDAVVCKTAGCRARVDENGSVVVIADAPGDLWTMDRHPRELART